MRILLSIHPYNQSTKLVIMESTPSTIASSVASSSQSFVQLWMERTELSYKRCVEDALACLRLTWPKERIIEKVMKAGDERVEKVTLDFEWRWNCDRKEVITQHLTEIGCDLTLVGTTKTGFTLTPMSKDEMKAFQALTDPMSLLMMMMGSGGSSSLTGSPMVSATLMDGNGKVISSSGGCDRPNCFACSLRKSLIESASSSTDEKKTDVDTKEIDEFAKIPATKSSSSSSDSDSE